MASARIQASSKHLRSEEALGETYTDQCGHYEIKHDASGPVHLLIRLHDASGAVIFESEVLYNAADEVTLDVTVPVSFRALQSELDRVLSAIQPFLGSMDLASLTAADVDCLSKSAELPSDLLLTLLGSVSLHKQAGIALTAFYGWARQGSPRSLRDILLLPDDALKATLEDAVRNSLIPAQNDQSLEQIFRRLDDLRGDPRFQLAWVWTARLLNAENGKPVSGQYVAVSDGASVLASVTSSGAGILIIKIADRPPADGATRILHLDFDGALEAIDVAVYPRLTQTQDVRVRFVPPPPPPSPALDSVAGQLGQIPQALWDLLASAGLHTLQDLQNAGRLSDHQGLAEYSTDPSLARLQAHADLSRLSPDLSLNSYLIDKGFTSPAAIAQATQSHFVQAATGRTGDFPAAALHIRATAQVHFLSNVVQNAAASPPASQPAWLTTEVQKYSSTYNRCDCDACQMAISPLAYLADLLDYAVRHLKASSAVIDLPFLVKTFYQPFDRLPASCESLDTLVRQVRICVEVLRRYLADKVPNAAQAAALATAEGEYCEAAWEALLAGIGTTSEEIRTSAATDDATRQALADKLGIDLVLPRPDALDALILTGPALTEAALEDLFGLVDTTRDPLLTGPTPQLQTWRLAHLRTLWQGEDWPQDVYASGTPIIDPDVLSPDDFRFPQAKALPADPDRAFDLWIKRRQWVDQLLTQFAGVTKVVGGQTVPDLAGLFTSIYVPFAYDAANAQPWALTTSPTDFDAVATQLTASASDADAAAATARIRTDLSLQPAEFLRLLALRDKDAVAVDPRNLPVQASEWQEVFSILAQAVKRAFFPQWITEEQTDAVELGPATFWFATREPKEGAWPPPGTPVLIDPDLVAVNDLPEPTAGQRAFDFLNARQAQLLTLRQDLESKRKSAGFETALLWALGDPNPGDPLSVNIATLASNLANGISVAATTADIRDNLFLSVPDFLLLVSIQAKDADPSPLAKPTESDWDSFNVIVSSAAKRKRLYPTWAAEESAITTGVSYWQALRGSLPAWRAPSEIREAWVTRLSDRTSPPLIDPDLIGPADFANPVAGDPAFDLWQARRALVDGQIAAMETLRASAATNVDAFDAMIEAGLKIDGKEIDAIQAKSDAGARISPRLRQLQLDFNSFNFMVGIRKLALANASILDTEWTQFESILAETWKVWQFPSWREEEKSKDILLSEDNFRSVSSLAGSVSVQADIVLTPWLATLGARQAWVDNLQARIDQDASVVQGVAQAADAAEAATLGALRDALILASAADGTDLATKASWITRHLAIDAEESTCQKTTRVAQAIETLQDVLFSVRAHDPGEAFPDLALDADHFDEEWTWLGSYSTWRSAILVFLYPENVCAPTLKPAQTPAFRALVQSVQGNAQLNPKSACEAAKQYSIYFRDICTLAVPASCYGWSRVRKQDRCSGTASDAWHMLLYMFGQGAGSANVYWSAYDPNNTTTQAQTFWAPLPGLDDKNIDSVAGAAPFLTSAGRRFVYVFVRGSTNGLSTIVFERVATDTQIPEGVGWTLDVPAGWGSFTIKVVPQGGDTTPPRIAVVLSTGEVWERSLDDTGMRWGAVDWRRLNTWIDWAPLSDRKVMSSPKHPPVSALARFPGQLDVFWVDADGGKIFTAWWDERSNNGQWVQPFQIGTLTTQKSGVTPLSRQANHIDLFLIADDGSVFSNWWDYNADSARWHDWFRIGAPGIAASAVVAVAQSPDHIDLFVIGPDKRLWSTWWDSTPANGQWPPWFPIGSPLNNPRFDLSACSRTNGRLDVFTILGDGQVMTTHWDADPSKGQWPDWVPLNGQPATYSDCLPAIARKPDHIDLFVFDINYQVSQASWDQNVNGGNWSLWNVTQPVTKSASFGSPVSAVSRFPDQLDVFFLDTDPLGNISVQSSWWDAWIDGAKWHPFFTIGNLNAADQHSFPAVSWDANRLDLFVIGADNRIYTSWFQSADWYTAGPNPMPPVAVKPFDIGPYDVTNDLSSTALQLRRLFIEYNMVFTSLAPDWIQEYLREAYFFVPMYLGMQLEYRGQYQAALDWYRTTYDYGAPVSVRKIYFGLVQEESLAATYARGADWLLDPLNPHKIARTRPNCYTRFTLQTIINCFLDWADSEYSHDTPESVPKARTLYLAAQELCSLPDLIPPGQHCGDEIGTLEIDIGDGHWQIWWIWLMKSVVKLSDRKTVQATVSRLKAKMLEATPLASRMGDALKIVREAQASAPPEPALAETNISRSQSFTNLASSLMAHTEIAQGAAAAGDAAAADLRKGIADSLEIDPALVSASTQIPWLRQPVSAPKQGSLQVTPPVPSQITNVSQPPSFSFRPVAFTAAAGNVAPLNPPASTSYILHQFPIAQLIPKYLFAQWVPPPSFYFCIPANPVLAALRQHIDVNLYKIRHCMNIAGMSRQLYPYSAPVTIDSGLPALSAGGTLSLPAAPSFQPTLYRYSTLIDRAKQLVQLAAQIEGSMLTALEQLATEQYALIKAQQDVQLAYAGVQLQTLRVQDAVDGVLLSQLQQQRAEILTDHYDDLIQRGTSDQEQDQIDLLTQSAALSEAAAAVNAAAAVQSAFSVDTFLKSGSGATALVASSLGSLAGAFGSQAQAAGLMAGYQRRSEDWQLQAALGQQDVRIGAQQVAVSQDQVRVAGQELTIAQMTSDNASAIADYLANKFTNAELFQWMSQVLQGVYSFFLQQATVMASLAQNQLSFERQQVTPAFIQSDYWRVESTGTSADSQDRLGLTGSARLLQDIYQLDQYAFQTDQRKLQLTKTISLATLAPFEFQQLRETGVLRIATPMEWFDRDFPGHILRLIRQVRVTVVALVPPSQGIRATLSSTGLSRVVIDGAPPQTIVLRRQPESIALSSPVNSTGLFDLQPSNGMLFPLEGTGVDTSLEFQMPRAANPFDFSSLADVLLTYDYTALDSYDHRQRILNTMSPRTSFVRGYNFRYDFEDTWYDLNNADQSATPLKVSFATTAQDFPPNLSDLRISQVLLYFSRADGSTFEVTVKALTFTPASSSASLGGAASTVDGAVSTLRGNAGGWLSLIGKVPYGTWQLTLPNTEQMRDRFTGGEITDILFMLTVEGSTPAWPQ